MIFYLRNLILIMRLLLIGLAFFLSSGLHASDPAEARIRCATVEYVNRLKAENPNYLKNKLNDERILRDLEQNISMNRISNDIYTIPVVVHVVYRTTAQNISDAQIQSQIDVLNEDFGRRNADTSLTPSFWKSIAGKSNFQFCLAKQDPMGNPTNGIERRSTTVNSFNTNNDVKYFSNGGLDAWDVNRYFNIWVCNLSNFLLGYAEPPSVVHSNDYGVVIVYDSFGRIGTVASPYDKGRTTTHEMGHAFALDHIWGDDSNCSGSDGISDTPNQRVESFGCPTLVPMFDSCTPADSGIMYMNYMDYTDDACMNMFTAGQVTRMQSVMMAFYPTLLSSDACSVLPGVSETPNNFSFSLYPNPSDGIVNLDMYLMGNIGSNVMLRVCNVLGDIVIEKNIDFPNGKTHQIDLQDQSSGIYFVTISNQNYNKTVRLELIK